MTRFVVLAVLCLAVVASAVPVAGAAAPLVPSQAQAIHDTKVEIVHRYQFLIDTSSTKELMPKAQVECDPLTDTLWRCNWLGKSRFYTVMGSAKVRFYKYDSDVSLYNLKCYRGVSGSDYCSQAGTPPVG
jgi:hypothetical protein